MSDIIKTISLPEGWGGYLDIGLDTPKEVAEKLKSAFPDEQAHAIAEYLYKPLREQIRYLVLREK